MSGQLPTDEPVTQGETTQTHEVAKFLRNYHVALVTLRAITPRSGSAPMDGSKSWTKAAATAASSMASASRQP